VLIQSLFLSVPSRTRILSHTRMGHPIRVWDIPYAYGHFPYPIRVWASHTRIGLRTRMGRYNCILRRLALLHCCLTEDHALVLYEQGALNYDVCHPGDITRNIRSPLAPMIAFLHG